MSHGGVWVFALTTSAELSYRSTLVPEIIHNLLVQSVLRLFHSYQGDVVSNFPSP